MYLYGNEEKMENEASDKKKDIKRGVQDGIPIALGYLSVSFAFGIMAVSAGLTCRARGSGWRGPPAPHYTF